ncbi:hypothetical protein D623_10024347 [Myotis brandtii]|uniref:Uncharacterized protein n=1 Tax=Myotis brandtii TaxID=109478 RepID=S7NJ44_MYOBR|nr:hypothetical protein D623_10024347 [Myotis brandtii]
MRAPCVGSSSESSCERGECLWLTRETEAAPRNPTRTTEGQQRATTQRLLTPNLNLRPVASPGTQRAATDGNETQGAAVGASCAQAVTEAPGSLWNRPERDTGSACNPPAHSCTHRTVHGRRCQAGTCGELGARWRGSHLSCHLSSKHPRRVSGEGGKPAAPHDKGLKQVYTHTHTHARTQHHKLKTSRKCQPLSLRYTVHTDAEAGDEDAR